MTTSLLAGTVIGLFNARHEQLLLHAIGRNGGEVQRVAVDKPHSRNSQQATPECDYVICSPKYFAELQQQKSTRKQLREEFSEIRSTRWLLRCINVKALVDATASDVLQHAEDEVEVPSFTVESQPPASPAPQHYPNDIQPISHDKPAQAKVIVPVFAQSEVEIIDIEPSEDEAAVNTAKGSAFVVDSPPALAATPVDVHSIDDSGITHARWTTFVKVLSITGLPFEVVCHALLRHDGQVEPAVRWLQQQIAT